MKRIIIIWASVCCLLVCMLTGCAKKSKPDDAIGQPPKTDDAKTEVAATEEPEAPYFRFVVSADSRGAKTGVHEEEMRSVMRCIKALDPQPEFMVAMGDLIQGAQTQPEIKSQYNVWKRVAEEFYPLNFYYPSVGNHEMTLRDQRGLDLFNDAFADTFSADGFYENGYGRSTYYFDQGNARFFVLNDYHPQFRHRIAPDVLHWMQENMDAAKAFHFVFCHEPAWPTSSHLNNSLDLYPAERNAFWKIVDAMPGAMFFAGHEHNYSRKQIDASFSETIGETRYTFQNAIQQVVVGGLGAPLQTGFTSKKGIIVEPQIVYCYAVADVYADHVRVRAYDIDDNLLDDFVVNGD